MPAAINYRRIYIKLKRRYPSIERQLNTVSLIHSIDELPGLYARYVTAQTETDKRLFYDSRLRFIAVVMQMEDPHWVEYDTKAPRGLATMLGNVLGSERSLISHSIQTVKNYMRLYPGFRQEVDYFYRKMIE